MHIAQSAKDAVRSIDVSNQASCPLLSKEGEQDDVDVVVYQYNDFTKR